MTTITFSMGTVDVIREITYQLKEANELREAELRLQYGDTAYFEIRNKMDKDIFGWNNE